MSGINPFRSSEVLISVIVPCMNEEQVIVQTNDRLVSVLGAIDGIDYEVIYVDDGSSDETPGLLDKLQAANPNIGYIRLSRNFGHQLAITAGIEHARGDAAIVIDADLQDPPEVIPEMIEKWRMGYHVVYGTRTERVGESKFKTGTAKAFYRLLNRLSDVKIPLDTGDFRLMDRKVIDAFLSMPETHRFVRGMVAWAGFNQIALPYRRDARAAGTTKYPIRKMLRFALDGVASFSLAPLRFMTLMGFTTSALAMMGILYALLARLLTDNWVPGWAATFIAFLFLGGIQLMSMGIIGEYIGRIYAEVKSRPLYLIQERKGFEGMPQHDGKLRNSRSDVQGL